MGEERTLNGMENSLLSARADARSKGPSTWLAKSLAAAAIALFWCLSAVGTTVGTTVGVTTLATAVNVATSTPPKPAGVTVVDAVAIAVGGVVAGTGAGGSSAIKRSRNATGRSPGTGPFFFDLALRLRPSFSNHSCGHTGAARKEADQALSRLRHGEAMRREHVSLNQISRKRKSGEEIAFAGSRVIVAKERRQFEQLGVVRLARLARDGAARARRDVDEIGVPTRRRAFAEIEAEAEVLQQKKLPAHQ